MEFGLLKKASLCYKPITQEIGKNNQGVDSTGDGGQKDEKEKVIDKSELYEAGLCAEYNLGLINFVTDKYELSKKLVNKPVFGLHKADDLVNIINYSDLYVHSAYAELESIACLEAIKCGLVPVINSTKRSATKNFAMSEHNLFKKNKVKDLVNKIEYWIEHPTEKEECAKKYSTIILYDVYGTENGFASIIKCSLNSSTWSLTQLRQYK